MLHQSFQPAAHQLEPAKTPYPGEPSFEVYQAEAREKIARSGDCLAAAPHTMDRLVQIMATEQRRSDRIDYSRRVYEAAKAARS